MAEGYVITIGRQFGSGGRAIGLALAERMGIPYYDKELLAEAAKDSGISKELFEDHDEKANRSFLFSLVTAAQMRTDTGSMYVDMPLNHKIFLAQFDAIRRIAAEGPCVIVGRCADYVLRDKKNVASVFVKADIKMRAERAIRVDGIDPIKAEDFVRKMDKQRANYYNYYATSEWGDINNYDLVLDTGKLGIDGSVNVILDYIRARQEHPEVKEI